MQKLIIGIAGPSAGGKTTVTRKICERFSDENITVISYDDYYREKKSFGESDRSKINYDHPNAFDTELLLKHLMQLKNNEPIKKPIYDFTVSDRSSEYELIEPTEIIIVEGLFTLLDKELLKLLDIKLYVETDSDECFIRRLVRDMNERERSLDSVINQYLSTVKPMYRQFIEPTRKYADIIIPRGGDNDVAIDLIQIKINSYIK